MAKKKEHISSKAKTEKVKKSDGSLEDPKYLITYITACKKEAYQASKLRRELQRELWLLFQNKENWSKKKDWQSKVFIPKIFNAIVRASSLVKKAILQTSKLFNMELEDEKVTPIKAEIRDLKRKLAKEAKGVEGAVNEQLSKALESAEERLELLKEQLAEDEKRFKKAIKKSNFARAYGEMIISAMLLGIGVLKRLWIAKKKRLRYENVDVLNIYISPEFMPYEDENPDYLIEYMEMSLAKLRKIATKTNKESKAEIFDMTEVNKVKGGYSKTDEQQKEKQRRGLGQYTRVSKKVGIDVFWGNVVSKDGREMKENQLMMLANEKYLIRKQDNPFDDGKIPYEITVPMVYPHRGISGVSLVESSIRLQYTLNNILNLTVDNLNFIVNKVRTYDPSRLKKPQEIHSVYPGKMIPVNSGTKPAIEEIKTTPLGQDVWRAYEIFCKEIEEANYITEFLTGMPGRKQKTLGEVEIKTAESHGMFDVIARELETNSIKPTLKNSYSLLVQFSDFKGSYEFNVGGLSLLLLMKDQIDKLMNALMIALKFPDQLGSITQIDELWEKLMSIWNLSELYKEREELPEEPPMLPGQVMGQQPGSAPAGVPPGQIEAQAAAEAKQIVAQIPPEEIMRV